TRVYGLDGLDATPVRLRLYGREEGDVPSEARPDVLLGELTLTLNAAAVRTISGHQVLPAFAEIAGVHAFGSPSGFQRLRLDVTPLREGKKIWALVSSTNNQTQHVTILEPLVVTGE
ncbi:MAG TPA: hypothetical protein VHL59_18385, partial [Thermoanaerobaculia bacterium]|nr:hypothetical protein [Thermoanaerobaculia bacterium]